MALTQVSTSGIKDGSVSTADLADGSITTAKVADGGVTTAKVADGGITTAKIADDAITADKLNNTGVTAGSYTLSSVTVDAQGRVTAASSGTPVDADKIIEGNTEVEAVDTGSDGHIKATTEGSERFRVGPAGQMGIGGANYGTSGQVLMSGGASAAPTWGDVSSSPTFEATASGALADGDTVIVNSNGTVSKPVETVGAGTSTNEHTFYGGSSQVALGFNAASIDYDTTNNRFALAVIGAHDSNQADTYHGSGLNSTYGYHNISTNTKVQHSVTDAVNMVFYPPTGEFFYIYNDKSISPQYGRIKRGSPQSGGWYFESPEQWDTGADMSFIDACYDPSTEHVVIAYARGGNSCYVVTYKNNSSTGGYEFGTASQFAGDAREIRVVYDANIQKVVVFYRDGDFAAQGHARVVTISNSGSSATVSFGTEATFETSRVGELAVAYDTIAQKIGLFYRNNSNTTTIGKVVNISGTTITFGTGVQFATETEYIRTCFDEERRRFAVFYQDRASGQNNAGKYRSAKISGNTMSFTTASVIQKEHSGTSQNSQPLACMYDPDEKKVAAIYGDYQFDGNIRTFNVVNLSTTLTTENYIGISNGAYSDGATATVQVAGSVDDAQSGLTPGRKQYILGDGEIGLTQGNPVVEAGVAVAATKLLIK